MAKILTFRNEERRDECVACGGASAQVIVFPGVRYERWDDAGGTKPAKPEAPASDTTKRTRGPQRDVLELAD